MRIAIFGIGAMGCLFGARLAPHAEVRLIGRWTEQIAALRAAPLRLISPDGSEEQVWLNVTEAGSAALPRDVDAALILIKSGGTAAAAAQAASLLKPDGIAVTLQNGLGNLETIVTFVGAERAALGVTTQGGATDGPGVVRIGGTGKTTFAVRPEIEGRIKELAALFNRAGLEAEIAADVSGLVWGKLAVNVAINPLTALLRVRNGALLESASAREVMGQAAREVAAVAAAKGIALPFEDAAARTEEVARLTGPNRSSMLQDVQRQAPTEIGTICGAVVREGEQAGIETPVNALLYLLVRAMEESYPVQVEAG